MHPSGAQAGAEAVQAHLEEGAAAKENAVRLSMASSCPAAAAFPGTVVDQRAAQANMIHFLRTRVLSAFAFFDVVSLSVEIIAQIWVLIVALKTGQHCSQPLRTWLVVRVFLQLAGLSISVASYYRTGSMALEGTEDDIAENDVLLRRLFALRRGFGSVYFFWFCMGNIYVMKGADCASEAPLLFNLCIMLILIQAISFAVPLALFLCMLCCLPVVLLWASRGLAGAVSEVSSARERDATRAQLAHLEALKFAPGLLPPRTPPAVRPAPPRPPAPPRAFLEPRERAFLARLKALTGAPPLLPSVICQEDYAEGDDLRRLPCQHLFHVSCADRWLLVRPVCPLCQRTLSEMAPGDLEAGTAGRAGRGGTAQAQAARPASRPAAAAPAPEAAAATTTPAPPQGAPAPSSAPPAPASAAAAAALLAPAPQPASLAASAAAAAAAAGSDPAP
eukprot:tig00020934_g16122.t1